MKHLKAYTLNAAVWRFTLFVLSTCAVFAYSSFSFFNSVEVYRLAIWLFLCLGAVIQLFTILVFIKLINFVLRLKQKTKTRPITKTQQIIALIYALLVVGIGYYNGQQLPNIKEVTIPVKDLPEELTITLISDIHVGPTIGKKRLEKVVNMVNYLGSGN